MFLVVGLGNPEPDYSRTRHNMGFDVVNRLAQKYNIEFNKKNFDAIYGSGIIEGEKTILLKPQTYMNLSGKAVIQYVNFYKIPLENVIVIYDDMDTEIGKIRVRSKGGPGSHNGMKSMVNELNSKEFPRIRVGIGKPKEEYDKINYVIGQIPSEEYIQLQETVNLTVEAITCYIKNGIDNAMNKYNAK